MPKPITTAPRVPLARATIDDRTLDAFIAVAEKAQIVDQLTDTEAAFLLQNVVPVARELQQRRRAAAVIRDLTDPDIVQLHPEAGA